MSDYTFIAYDRADADFTLRLANSLKSKGVNIWLDQWNLSPGATWLSDLDRALRSCAHFLIILSPAAIASIPVQGEIITAINVKKPIVPILYQPCQIMSMLAAYQYVDFVNRSPEDDAALNEVLNALGVSLLNAPPAANVSKKKQLPTTTTNGIDIEFVLISASKFMMGSDNGRKNEQPVREVTIGESFYLSRYPITRIQWKVITPGALYLSNSKFTG